MATTMSISVFQNRKNALEKEHNAFVEQENNPVKQVGNGIYTRYQNPILTDEEAYNVAVYMNLNEHERPEKENREKDFPDAAVKAPDAYIQGKDSDDRRFGPFGQFIKSNK